MLTLLRSLLTSLCLSPALLVAQTQDVGLTMDGGVATVLYGQICGPVSCTPMPSGPVAVGTVRNLTHYGAPQTLYAIALGFPGPCVPVAGFDNALLLQGQAVIGWGLTSAPPFVGLPCQQGMANEWLAIPATAPAGLTFRVQSFGESLSGVFAFGPAIEATTN